MVVIQSGRTFILLDAHHFKCLKRFSSNGLMGISHRESNLLFLSECVLAVILFVDR